MVNQYNWNKVFIAAMISAAMAGSSVCAQWQKIEVKNKSGDPVAVTCIDFEDTLVWIGTNDAGVKQFAGLAEKFSLSKDQTLISNKVRSVAVDKAGKKWMATDEGLEMWDGRQLTHFRKNDITLFTNNITALDADDYGEVWAGTDKGLARINGDRWSLFDKKSTNKLLPTNTSRAIATHWKGVTWIATDEGLVSFDGKVWRTFTKKENGLPSNDINDVSVASDGTVWIATDNGVGKWNGTTCINFLSETKVRSVAVDLLGNCWAATKEDGVVEVENGKEKSYGVKDGLLSDETHSVRCDPYGDIWVGSKLGLNRFTDRPNAARLAAALFQKAEEFRAARDFNAARKYYNLFFSKDYLQGAKELPLVVYNLAQTYLADDQTEKAKELYKQFLTQFPTHEKIKSIILELGDISAAMKKLTEAQQYYQQYLDAYPEDAQNQEVLWKMATLLEKDGDTFGASRLYQKLNNKFPSNTRFNDIRWKIANMDEKQKGRETALPVYNDLVSSSKDFEILYRLSDLYDAGHRSDVLQNLKGGVEWKSYSAGSGVNYLLLDGNNLWMGTQSNGVVKWDISGNAYVSYVDGLSGQNIRQVYIDSDRDVWSVVSGVTKNSLCNMNYSKNRTKWIPMGYLFNNKTVFAILYLPKSKSTVAATDQGLAFSGGGNKTFTSRNGLPADKVKFVLQDSQGILWLICDKYLVQLDKEPKMIVNSGEADYSDVRGFFIDAVDTKWLATDQGLVSYDGNWKQTTAKDGLISNDVQCVAVSKSGKILAGTKQGLSYFNKVFWMNYSTANGLPSNDVRSALFVEDDNIWIGTDKGAHFRKSSWEGDKFLMVQSVLAQEENLWNQKNFVKARQNYNFLNLYSDLAEWIAFRHAVSMEREGKTDTAYAAYKKIRQDNPVSIWATDFYWYRIARKYEDQSQFDRAVSVLAELSDKMKAEKKDTYRIEESLYRIGFYFQNNKNADKALNVYRQIKQNFPNSALLPNVADQLVQIAGNYEKANLIDLTSGLYQEFLAGFPNDARALQVKLSLAKLYEGQSKFAEAHKIYTDLNHSLQEGPSKLAVEKKLARVQLKMRSN